RAPLGERRRVRLRSAWRAALLPERRLGPRPAPCALRAGGDGALLRAVLDAVSGDHEILPAAAEEGVGIATAGHDVRTAAGAQRVVAAPAGDPVVAAT